MPPGDEYIIGYLFIPVLNLPEMSDTLTWRTGQFRRPGQKREISQPQNTAFALVQGQQTAAAALAKFNTI